MSLIFDTFGLKRTGFLCRTCLPDGPVDFLGNNRPAPGHGTAPPDYRAALGRWRTKASMCSTLSSWERMASFWPGVQASKNGPPPGFCGGRTEKPVWLWQLKITSPVACPEIRGPSPPKEGTAPLQGEKSGPLYKKGFICSTLACSVDSSFSAKDRTCRSFPS